ncbi:hypothetical protein C8Q76DRAFT_173507 [Earliella scabrosa]|nr:hypothetical protein C8Q76DRAFT_173507 [Earliella scabrosa]
MRSRRQRAAGRQDRRHAAASYPTRTPPRTQRNSAGNRTRGDWSRAQAHESTCLTLPPTGQRSHWQRFRNKTPESIDGRGSWVNEAVSRRHLPALPVRSIAFGETTCDHVVAEWYRGG